MVYLKSICLKSNSEEQTRELAKELAKYMFKGAVICLEGDLGVGKTQFTQSFCYTLGVKDYITSPTFTIVNEYEGDFQIYHFDAYRISDLDELREIGFDEYIYSDGVSIIEWADIVIDVLPEEKLWIKIEKTSFEDFNERNIKIDAYGDKYETIIDNLRSYNNN